MPEEIRLLNNSANRQLLDIINSNNFHNIQRLVSPSLNPGNRRGGGVGYEWFRNTFRTSPMKYAYLTANNNNTPNEYKTVVGLAALNNYNRGRVLHALVTNKGKGMPMMKKIINNAIANNKNYINLNAVPSVEGFYRHRNLGFVNRKGNTNKAKNNGLVPLTKWLRTNRPNNRVGNNVSPRASGGLGKFTKKYTPAMKLAAKKALVNYTPVIRRNSVKMRGGLGMYTKRYTPAMRRSAKKSPSVTRSGRIVKPTRR